jgi:dTDP-4-amino-4,6-dideoxygalactose transaminase
MEFNDLRRQYKLIESGIEGRLKLIFQHGRYINGPEVGAIEEVLAKYVGVDHAVGCASGTDALLLALMALNIKTGDRVFTSAFSFVAAAEAIALLGAKPVFVDIDPLTFNMDPQDLRKKIEIEWLSEAARTEDALSAIIAVNLFGAPCDYDIITQIGNDYGIPIIEDAAQSFGAEYQGFRSPGLVQIGCTSFFPSKPLGCYGDGGMLFVRESHLYHKLMALRSHGSGEVKYYSEMVGLNSRLDTIQAAVLLEKFGIFEDELALRREKALDYLSRLANIFDFGIYQDRLVSLSARQSAWSQFPILCDNEQMRSNIILKFLKDGIPHQIYYPLTLPEMPAYKSKICPVAHDVSRRILHLPFSPYITYDEIKRVCESIKGAL